MDTANDNSVGPVVGVIIILVVIVLGGLYFWSSRDGVKSPDTSTDSTTAAIDSQSSSDDTSSLQTDLNNTDTTNLDSELNAS